MKSGKNGFYCRYIKRALDLLLSTFAMLILGIPMLVVAVLIRIDMGTPVLFKQKRLGKDKREFYLFKFRSMTDARDANGVYLPDPDRITKLGRFIRTTSIDELPSLLNIIKGDMSIIGPRPLPTRYKERYTSEQLRRHEIKPGLSSPSVVNGRNLQTWEDQFKGDVWYVDHVSFGVDCKSVIDTLLIVLNHKGATSSDGDSRGEFIGTADVRKLEIDTEGNYMKLK